MDAPMTPREAVAWLLENTAATRKTYCIILRSTNGVHNPGTRGMLICQAAELAGRLHAYRESLHHMMQAGMIPADLLELWPWGCWLPGPVAGMWATAMPCGMRNGCTMMMLYSAPAKAVANDGGGTRGPD